MMLARELLHLGERDAVLDYLRDCRGFWKMDGGRLEQWTAAILGGDRPDFGSQLGV